MNELNEIRKYAGLNEEYLTEGIRFFKNSSKINRLHKRLAKKREFYFKKGRHEEAQNLTYINKQIEKVFNDFKKLEDDFKKSDKSKKQNVKSKYNQVSKKYNELLNVTSQDELMRTLYITGSIGIFTGIVLAGGLTLISMVESGKINTEAVAQNLDARARKSGIVQHSGSSGDDILSRSVQNFVDDKIIQATNNDLMKTASVTGATASGVVSVGVIQKLKEMGRDNTLIGKTAEAIENLKNIEKKKEEKKHQSGEGDDK